MVSKGVQTEAVKTTTRDAFQLVKPEFFDKKPRHKRCDTTAEDFPVQSYLSPMKDDPNDPNYEPPSSPMSDGICSESAEEGIQETFSSVRPESERKFIVFEGNLLELFKTCRKCTNSTRGVVDYINGSLVKIRQICTTCLFEYVWFSQPFVGNKPAGNLMISAGILFSGLIPSKTLRMYSFNKIQTIGISSFINHQRYFLHPAIEHVWNNFQEDYFNDVVSQGRSIVVGGDGRADTPGHSAKFGNYTMMDLNEGIVIDIQLVQVLNRTMDLDDENGRQLPALTVFSLSIKYIHDNLLQECNRQLANEGVNREEIHWVITVPAIWNDAAKQFMREAAELTGIKAHKLTIALEPETASIFCKHLAVEKHVSAQGLSIDTFSPGSKYIVLDAGGGTVDITIHEVLPNDQLKELHNASGGAWGGTAVDEQFFQFLIKIFGAPLMMKFKNAHMDDYLDIVRDFEVKKRGVSFEDQAAIIRLPATLMEMFEEETGEKLKSTIGQMNFIGEVTLQTGNKLRVDAACLRGFFRPAIKDTLDHLDELTKHPAANGIRFLLMVGGFSESVYLQDNIRKKFPKLKVIVPPEAGLVVLKGAAIFGHADAAISQRVSKYTYGFIGNRPFVEGSDPEEHAVTNSRGKKTLKDAFLKLVEKGEPIKEKERREWKGNRVAQSENPVISFPLFGSHQKDPLGEWSRGTFPIGKLRVQIQNMSVPKHERKFRITGIFGKTEIELQALELSTGKLTSATFDALQ